MSVCPLCKLEYPDGQMHGVANCADHLKVKCAALEAELATANRRIASLELIATQRKVRIKGLRQRATES